MHDIRLRGPWHVEPLARFELHADGMYRQVTSDLPPPARVKMPADWGDAFGRDFLGRVAYRRTFQMPTGLDEGQRVWLVVEPPRSLATVTMSGELLGEVRHDGPAGRYDITDRLQEHNHLDIVVDHPALDATARATHSQAPPSTGGLVGEVRLEIEE